MSDSQDKNRRVYGRGYDDGFRDAMEQMRRDGWRRVRHWYDLREGDTVKLLKKTIMGWRGLAYVVDYDRDIVRLRRFDYGPDEYGGEVCCCPHELAKHYDPEPAP